jgi:hypothetical protein
MTEPTPDFELLSTDAVPDRMASTLADKFRGIFNPETVGRYVHES